MKDETTAKEHLRHYLQEGRDALLWKLEGLSEYDVRRPLVPTGTNLLGLVKHVAGTVTLHRILVHMTAETHRHVGHADIVRELIDGRTGLRLGNENLPIQDTAWWEGYRASLEETALAAVQTE